MKPENYQKIQELMAQRITLSDRLKVVEKERLREELEEQLEGINSELEKL